MTTDETTSVLMRIDNILPEYLKVLEKKHLADVAWNNANWAVLRARLEGKEPDAQMIREFFKTIVDRDVAIDREAHTAKKLDVLFVHAAYMLAEREIP